MPDPVPPGECALAVVGSGIIWLAVARECRCDGRGCSPWCSTASATSPGTRQGATAASCTPGSTTARARSRRALCRECARAVRLLRRARDRLRAPEQADRRARRLSRATKRLETRLDGPRLLESDVHGDERGFFLETYAETCSRSWGSATSSCRTTIRAVGAACITSREVRCARGAILACRNQSWGPRSSKETRQARARF
jgi:hypothetical protein